MQRKPSTQELEFSQNSSLWQNNQLRLTRKENPTEVKPQSLERYSWRDIQGLSWIFEEEVYE